MHSFAIIFNQISIHFDTQTHVIIGGQSGDANGRGKTANVILYTSLPGPPYHYRLTLTTPNRYAPSVHSIATYRIRLYEAFGGRGKTAERRIAMFLGESGRNGDEFRARTSTPGTS